MPKNIRLAISLVVSTVLFIALMIKVVNTLGNLSQLKEVWHLDEPERAAWDRVVIFGLGVYILIAFTAVSAWTRGVLPIVLSGVSFVFAFVLYCVEVFFVGLLEGFGADVYMGFDPGISVTVHYAALVVLAVSIADFIIEKKKNRY